MPYSEIEFTRGFSLPELLGGRSNCAGIAWAKKYEKEKSLPSSSRLVMVALVNKYIGEGPTRHMTTAVLEYKGNGEFDVLFLDKTPWLVEGGFSPWGYNQVTGGRYRPISWSITREGEIYPSILAFNESVNGILPSPFLEVKMIPDELMLRLVNSNFGKKRGDFPGIEFDLTMKEIKHLKDEGNLKEAAYSCCELISRFPQKISPFWELYNIFTMLSDRDLECGIEEYFPEVASLNSNEIAIYFLIRAAELLRQQIKTWQNFLGNKEEIIRQTARWRIGRAENGLNEIKKLLPPSNWGIIIFKPPRATLPEIFPRLRRFLTERAGEKGLAIYGPICFNFSEKYLKIIYPEDYTQPYWPSLVDNLLGRDAYLFLLKKEGGEDDIEREVHWLKGWVGVDFRRGRVLEMAGLRSDFYRILQERGEEGVVNIKIKDLYQDTGIHAPISWVSRWRQWLLLMNINPELRELSRKLKVV